MMRTQLQRAVDRSAATIRRQAREAERAEMTDDEIDRRITKAILDGLNDCRVVTVDDFRRLNIPMQRVTAMRLDRLKRQVKAAYPELAGRWSDA